MSAPTGPPAGARPTVRVLPDAAAVQRAAAEEFAARTAAAVRAHGVASVALSGGSTPRGLHALLADPSGPFRARVPWAQLEVFWGDERCVPPGAPDSNYRMVRETLLAGAPVPEGNVHRIRAEEGATAAALAYEEELRAHFCLREGAVPRFDLVLLGIGEDGHTASLFPGSAALRERRLLAIAARSPRPPLERVTLTLPVLNAASCVVFLASGTGKAEAVAAVLRRRDMSRPAALVRPEKGDLLWFLDAAAASGTPPGR